MLGQVRITDRGMASADNLTWLRQTGRHRQVGRILQKSQRSAARFAIKLEPDGRSAGIRLDIVYNAAFDDRAALSQGGNLLRSNVDDWSDRQLWKAYIQLTPAEAAFRIQKDHLNLRRSGTSARIAYRLISSSAFLPSCCGRLEM